MPVSIRQLLEDSVFAELTHGAREEGRRDVVRMQLETRFGPLPPSVEERLNCASAEQINTFAIKVLICPSLEQIVRDSLG